MHPFCPGDRMYVPMGYCPREGYKVASHWIRMRFEIQLCYCPREGYKVASYEFRYECCTRYRVTVPVRGSRGDRCQRQKQGATAGAALRVLQAPCRCAAKIGKAQEEEGCIEPSGVLLNAKMRYCPREGYKVASQVTLLDTNVRTVVTVPVRGIRLHQHMCQNSGASYLLLSP